MTAKQSRASDALAEVVLARTHRSNGGNVIQVVDNAGARLRHGGVAAAVHVLVLQRGPEAFDEKVVNLTAFAVHRAGLPILDLRE